MGLGDRISSSFGNKLSRIKGVLKHKTDQVYIGAIGLLLALIGVIFVVEFMQPEPALTVPSTFEIEPHISTDKSTEHSLIFYSVQENSAVWPEMEESPFIKFTEINMFDAKAVRAEAESVEGARLELRRAEASMKEGDLVAALRHAKEAERQSPGLAGAKEMIRKIDAAE